MSSQPAKTARSKSPKPPSASQLQKMEVQAAKSKLAAEANQKKLDEAKALKDAAGDDKSPEKTEEKKPVPWEEWFKTCVLTSNVKVCWILCAFALIAASVAFQPPKVLQAVSWALCMMSLFIVISFDEKHRNWNSVVVACTCMFVTGIAGVNTTTCYASDEMYKSLTDAKAADTFKFCRRAILADSQYMKANKEATKKAKETLENPQWDFWYTK